MDNLIEILQRIHQNHIKALEQDQAIRLHHLRLAIERYEALRKSKGCPP